MKLVLKQSFNQTGKTAANFTQKVLGAAVFLNAKRARADFKTHIQSRAEYAPKS